MRDKVRTFSKTVQIGEPEEPRKKESVADKIQSILKNANGWITYTAICKKFNTISNGNVYTVLQFLVVHEVVQKKMCECNHNPLYKLIGVSDVS